MGRDDLTEQLRDFRERYPIDDRASDFLEKIDREVLATVLAEFRPKREGEGNYSALVTNFVRSVQSRMNRQQKNERRKQSTSSDPRERRTRVRRYDSSESSEDSFGRTRKLSVPARRHAGSSSEPRKIEAKVGSEEESPLESLEELQAAVTRAQEQVSRVEADARDEERLKVGKAEDAMNREVDEAVTNARERFQREMEQKLKEVERRLHSEMEQKIEDERQNQEEAARSRKMELERDARQERERLIEEAERALRQKRKQVMLAQKKLDRAQQKAIAKAKQMVSSSEEPRRAAKKKEKVKEKEEKVKKDRKPAYSDESSLDCRRSRREKETRPKLNGRSGDRRDRRSSHSEESSPRHRELRLAAYKRSGRSRSRSRSPIRLKTSRTGSEGPTQRELDDFRDRYPIDSRAYGVLTSVPGEVQKAALNQFRPKREGESDYSALVASFVRAVMHRHSQMQLQPRAAETLADFRARYPMDDRAFAVLERTSSGVQNTVLADFRPRREGENDYSALVMGFIRSIEARTGTGIDRGRGGRGGYRRDDDGGSRSCSESEGLDDRRR